MVPEVMRSDAAMATRIFVVVVVFISAIKRDVPAADVPASADAADRVAATVAVPMDAWAPCVARRVIKAVPDTVTPCLPKNFRRISIAADSSRLATLSEQPTRFAAARWLLFWK